jgi:hypothetical protein
MKTSMRTAALATALSRAQASLDGVTIDTTPLPPESEYADLATIWRAIRRPLAENGLSIVQMPDYHDNSGYALLVTRLMHASGEWIEGSHVIRSVRNDHPQGMAGAITHARRNALMAVLGLAQEDFEGGGIAASALGDDE